MRCVFDENMPIKLARALRVLESSEEITVQHMRELFDAGTTDAMWIKELGKEKNCFVITRDNKIKTNKAELNAWEESGLTIVFLQNSWFNLSFWDICWKFIKIWQDLKSTLSRNANLRKLMIHIKGKIEELNSKPISDL